MVVVKIPPGFFSFLGLFFFGFVFCFVVYMYIVEVSKLWCSSKVWTVLLMTSFIAYHYIYSISLFLTEISFQIISSFIRNGSELYLFYIKIDNLNIVFESFRTQLTSLQRNGSNNKEYISVNKNELIYLHSNRYKLTTLIF